MFNFIKNLFFGKNEELENNVPKEPKIQQIDIDHLESDIREKEDKIRERDKTIHLLEAQIKFLEETIQEQRKQFISSQTEFTKDLRHDKENNKNTREKAITKKEN